eukprot:9771831-Ditylum_brightwellii.AAC.1
MMGWILILLPWVMEDCKEKNRSLHQLAVEQVRDKLYNGHLANTIGKAKNDFWTEWDDFISKQGD